MIKSKKILLGHNLYKDMTVIELFDKYKPYISNIIHYLYKYQISLNKSVTPIFDLDDLKNEAFIVLQELFNIYDVDRGILFFTVLKSYLPKNLYQKIRDTYHLRSKCSKDSYTVSIFEEKNNDDNKSICMLDTIEMPENIDREDLIDLKMAMSKLNDQEKKIIHLRFYEDKTQNECKTLFNLSQAQISRKEKKIIKKLQKYMKIGGKEMSFVKYQTKIDAIYKKDFTKYLTVTALLKEVAKELGVTYQNMLVSLQKHNQYENLKKQFATENEKKSKNIPESESVQNIKMITTQINPTNAKAFITNNIPVKEIETKSENKFVKIMPHAVFSFMGNTYDAKIFDQQFVFKDNFVISQLNKENLEDLKIIVDEMLKSIS